MTNEQFLGMLILFSIISAGLVFLGRTLGYFVTLLIVLGAVIITGLIYYSLALLTGEITF